MFASGHDDLFAVRLNTEGVTARGMIADTSGILGDFMQTMVMYPLTIKELLKEIICW